MVFSVPWEFLFRINKKKEHTPTAYRLMSCLFKSLGQLLHIPTDSVRQQVCDYLSTDNNTILEGMTTFDLLALEDPCYIENMKVSSTWGGAIEIQTAVRIWNVNVTVQNRRDTTAPPIMFVTQGVATATLTLYWTGNHYEPVSIVH